MQKTTDRAPLSATPLHTVPAVTRSLHRTRGSTSGGIGGERICRECWLARLPEACGLDQGCSIVKFAHTCTSCAVDGQTHHNTGRSQRGELRVRVPPLSTHAGQLLEHTCCGFETAVFVTLRVCVTVGDICLHHPPHLHPPPRIASPCEISL
jgi:hypothetical protein